MTNFVLDLLAAGAILSGLLVITSRNPVISVLYLIAVFVNAAGYLLVLGVGFIGISYLIVYVGAIAILFLFVVMLLNINISQIVFVGNQYTQNLPLGLLLATLFFVEIIYTLPIWDMDINLLRLTYLFNTFNDILINNADNWITYFNTYLNFNVSLDNNITTLQQVQSIGINLFAISPLWLILASFILLLAIIGPIVLCLRIKPSLS